VVLPDHPDYILLGLFLDEPEIQVVEAEGELAGVSGGAGIEGEWCL